MPSLRCFTIPAACVLLVLTVRSADLRGESGTAALSSVAGPAESRRILDTIRANGRRIYGTYVGVRSRRRSLIHEYDAASKQIRKRIELTAERVDYYDRMPSSDVTRYNLNGKELSPALYDNVEFAPPYPVFDERGEERYHVRLTGTAKIEGALCWQLRVTPRGSSRRHFKGDMYFTKDDLALKYMKGTFASLQLGLQEFEFEFYFERHEGVPVFTRGAARGTVYVPLIRYTYHTSEMTIDGHELVKK